MYAIRAPITGIAMLFSAGTFLYVATVHVLSEVTSRQPQGASGGSIEDQRSRLSKQELLLVVTGALLPLVFNFVHSH